MGVLEIIMSKHHVSKTAYETVIRMGAAHWDINTKFNGVPSVSINLKNVPSNVQRDTLTTFARDLCDLHGIK